MSVVTHNLTYIEKGHRFAADCNIADCNIAKVI